MNDHKFHGKTKGTLDLTKPDLVKTVIHSNRTSASWFSKCRVGRTTKLGRLGGDKLSGYYG